MALFLSMPSATFNRGDTAECKINGKPTKVIWGDGFLVLQRPGEPDDLRIILDVVMDLNGLWNFTCGNAADDEDQGPVTIVRPGSSDEAIERVLRGGKAR